MVFGSFSSCVTAKIKPFIRTLPSSSFPRPMIAVSTAITKSPLTSGMHSTVSSWVSDGFWSFTRMMTWNSWSDFFSESTSAPACFPILVRFCTAVSLSTSTVISASPWMPSRTFFVFTTGIGHCSPLASTVYFCSMILTSCICMICLNFHTVFIVPDLTFFCKPCRKVRSARNVFSSHTRFFVSL